MKFIDEVVINITAGKGGDGSASFRREKFIPYGGPDGGDGGNGGDIFLKGNPNTSTLADYRYTKNFKSENGTSGRGQQKYGKNGKNLYLKVPLGCVIYDDETTEIIGEVLKKDEEVLVANGGVRGIGNVHFKSSTNRAPRQFTKGKAGESRKIRIELKLIADAGLVGLPNAGKSSFINQISNANVKADSYPFTTLNPHLAKVNLDAEKHLIVADIPGIIEGASKGVGLGLKFLRHISRTKVLIHLIDINPIDGKCVFDNAMSIINELINYSEDLTVKKQILVLNKIDLLSEKKAKAIGCELFDAIIKNFKNSDSLLKNLKDNLDPNIFLISAEKNQGIKELVEYIHTTYFQKKEFK